MHEKNTPEIRQKEEENLNALLDRELTDDQLLQFAEGSCSWGANCTELPCEENCDVRKGSTRIALHGME